MSRSNRFAHCLLMFSRVAVAKKMMKTAKRIWRKHRQMLMTKEKALVSVAPRPGRIGHNARLPAALAFPCELAHSSNMPAVRNVLTLLSVRAI